MRPRQGVTLSIRRKFGLTRPQSATKIYVCIPRQTSGRVAGPPRNLIYVYRLKPSISDDIRRHVDAGSGIVSME